MELNLDNFGTDKLFSNEAFEEFWKNSYEENLRKTFGDDKVYKNIARQAYKIGCYNAGTRILTETANQIKEKNL